MLAKNLIILMIVGILFLILPIEAKNCIQQKMNGEYYFDYNYIDQYNYDYWSWVIPILPFYLFKESRFQSQKFSRGSFGYYIDFKRDFHFFLRDISKYVWTLDSLLYLKCETNYGIAVTLGPYYFVDYPDKTGELKKELEEVEDNLKIKNIVLCSDVQIVPDDDETDSIGKQLVLEQIINKMKLKSDA